MASFQTFEAVEFNNGLIMFNYSLNWRKSNFQFFSYCSKFNWMLRTPIKGGLKMTNFENCYFSAHPKRVELLNLYYKPLEQQTKFNNLYLYPNKFSFFLFRNRVKFSKYLKNPERSKLKLLLAVLYSFIDWFL